MTSLYLLNIDSVDCKSSVTEFTVRKRFFYPDVGQFKLAKGVCDALKVPAVNHLVQVSYTDSIGSYTVFYGKITKISTQGRYYTIEASSSLMRAFDFLSTYEWASAAHDDIMVDLLDATAGPSFTVTNNASYATTLSRFKVTNQPAIDALRKLVFFSANDTSDKFTIFRQDSTAQNTIIVEDYGETAPSSAITLRHSNGALLGKLQFDDVSADLINIVQVAHRGGLHTSADGDTGGYSTSTSRTNYGSKTLKLYRPEIDNSTDAIATEATILRAYSDPIDRFKVNVRHGALHGNSTHYSVLNTPYTVIDDINGQTYTGIVCIEHVIRWPSYQDTLTFGMFSPFIDQSSQILDVQKRLDVLERDSAGLNVAFKAYRTTTQSITNASGTKVQFNTESTSGWDVGGNYDSATNYYFTAPINGYYSFSAVCGMTMEAGKFLRLSLIHGSTTIYQVTQKNYSASSDTLILQISGQVKMAAGDTVYVEVYHDNSTSTNLIGALDRCNFCGNLISIY